MDETRSDLIRKWIEKAHGDLESARKLASAPDPILETAFFHCQQAAEKAVKGYLAYRDRPLEKTHDVERLVSLAMACEPGFAAWQTAAETLTPYATAYRYPRDVVEPDAELYQEAEQAATGLFGFVCSLLPEEVRPSRSRASRQQ
jgi:HEPN domain-containing protein